MTESLENVILAFGGMWKINCEQMENMFTVTPAIVKTISSSLLLQTPDPSIREGSVPVGHHDDHEATPTPETIGVGVNAEKEPESEGLTSEGGDHATKGGGGGEGVKTTDQESSEKEVKLELTQSEPEAVVPEVTVVVEMPPASSAELSQTSVEGGDGEREEGEGYVIIETTSGDGVNIEVREKREHHYYAVELHA